MVYNKTNTSKKHLRTAARMALAWLVLSILAPKGSHSEDSPSTNNNGLQGDTSGLASFTKAPDFNSGRAKLIKSQIKEMAGRVVIDSQLEVTQPLQVDKKLTFISLSTPTATPSSGHADMWLNNTAKAICTKFDDGSSGCLGTGGGGGSGVTSFTAGIGLTSNGTTGALAVGLSTPILSSYIPDYVSGTAVAAATSTLTTRLISVGVSTAAIAVDTGTFLTKSSATASYIANSTLSESKTLYVSSGTLTNLNTTTLKFADGTMQTSAAAGFATLVATQTWSGINTYSSTSTLNGKNLIKGTTTNDNARAGDNGEYVTVNTNNSTVNAGTSTQFADIISTTVTAGDWDVTGVVYFIFSGTPTNGVVGAVSLFSGNTTTDHVLGYNELSMTLPTSLGSVSVTIPRFRVSVNSTTTIYLKQKWVYTGGPPLGEGSLTARRVR